MRTKGNILLAFILLMAWVLSGVACHGKYHRRATEGIEGSVGVSLDIDPVTPIDGSDNRQVYPVKFVCGNFVPEVINDAIDPEGPLFPGAYLTAINIVNPIDGEGDAILDIRATQTFIQDPENGRGIVGSPVTETLLPYHGLEIDCADIRELLGNPPELFLKGFVLIETAHPLSVVPLYTVQSVEEDLTTQAGKCWSLASHARYAIIQYQWLVARFIITGGTTSDCDDLRNAHQLATDNTDRCVTVCGAASCPTKPLAPGLIDGTEKCTVVD